MEARQLSHEHRFRYAARGVLLLVALLLCLDVFLLPLPASGSEEPSALAMSNFYASIKQRMGLVTRWTSLTFSCLGRRRRTQISPH